MKKGAFYILLLFIAFACDDITEVEDISENVVSVLAPTDNSILIEGDVVFSWNSIEDAENYRIQVATPDFDNATQIVLDSVVSLTNISKNLQLGNYQWRVRAENSEYQTIFTTQSFTIEE